MEITGGVARPLDSWTPVTLTTERLSQFDEWLKLIPREQAAQGTETEVAIEGHIEAATDALSNLIRNPTGANLANHFHVEAS